MAKLNMLVWVFIASVFAAALNAGSSVLQRQAAGQPDVKALFSRKFAYEVSRHPLFLMGLGLQVLAAIMQAVALSKGPLVIVEPVLTLDLIFLLIFLNKRFGIKAGRGDWLAVFAILTGLSGLFVIAQPSGGHSRYHLGPWLIVAVIYVLATIIGPMMVRQINSVKSRAMLAAFITAGSFAVNAGLIKLVLNQLGAHGVAYIFTSWPIYAFIVSGIASLLLMQNMYGAGPLAISQPVLEIAEPSLSVTIGILVFGDSLKHSSGALLGEVFCSLVLAWGIIKLASSKELSAGL